MTLPDALALEQAGMKAWPGIDMSRDGSWVRRAANGFTQRANSVEPLDPADGGNLDRRIAASRTWFGTRGLPAIFRITPLAPPRLVAKLDAAGWTSVGHSVVLAMTMPDAASDPRCEILDAFDERFLAAQQVLQGYGEEERAKFEALMRAVRVPMAGVVLHAAGNAPAASALFAVADGISVTGNVITHGAERRKGYGAAMMRTGLAWAKAQGAIAASLNVAADNAAGRALYHSLGYGYQYDYVYRYPGTT